MARSRVINIQRVSLSIYVYVSESDTYDTHATPFRGKKKKKDSSPAGLCTIRGIHCETRFNGEIRRWNSSFENERLHGSFECLAHP